jgi:hypothetical protein
VENGHQRELTSVLGSVTVTRKAYRAVPGSVCPAGGEAISGAMSATRPDCGPDQEPDHEQGQMSAGPGATGSTPAAAGLVAGRTAGTRIRRMRC